MPHYPSEIEYSDHYEDEVYEYRHVILTKAAYAKIKGKGLLEESEWRALGIKQTKGWVHYTYFFPEPNVLLFRRPLGTDPQTGNFPAEMGPLIEDYDKKKRQNLNIKPVDGFNLNAK